MKKVHLYRQLREDEKERNSPLVGLDESRTACGLDITPRTPIAEGSTKVVSLCKSCLSFTDYATYRTVAGGTL